MHSIKSGTKVFDWVIPPEYNVKDAYIITPDGDKICDFKEHNLHLLGYSQGVDLKLDLDELNNHLYSLPELENAIPYVTSYYKKRWGFCLTHKQRKGLKPGVYHAFIDAKHDENGCLNYADLLIPSTCESSEEVLISSYLCHPQMANNELSGPIVATFLAKFIAGLKTRKYNYRFVIVPETIGSITYLSQNLEHLKANVKAGFVLSCVGDDLTFSLVKSPNEHTLSDRVARHILKTKDNFKEFSFLDRGSDERQYNSPLVNLGVVGICRTKYGDFKEYHTSLDDLDFITPAGLNGALNAMREIILCLELNETYLSTTFCEPNLGSRGLYPTLSRGQKPLIADFLAFCDASKDVIDIAEILGVKAYELKKIIKKLLNFNLIKEVK